ncbi:MAG TPA: histidine triad nucleotide-binding protein [Acidimicrobiales bacterium]
MTDTADCLFCRIVAGEIPADIVHRSDHAVAFRDLNPQAPVHVLVVPRRHIDHAGVLEPGDADALSGVFQAALEVAESEGIAERGYRLVFNVGEDASNSVPHLHLHVLGGRRLAWPPG